MRVRVLAACVACFFVSGCAVGNRYDLGSRKPDIGIATEKAIAASVVDLRPYVLSGDKAPDFVGLQRGGFGNPFDVTTQSGRPLAEDLTGALVSTMKERGVDAEALTLPRGTSAEEALARFRTLDADRFLFLQMREWKTDAMMRLTLHWDLEATVYDEAGAALADHEISGVEPIGAAGLESGNSAMASGEIARKMSELLNHPDIVTALE